MRLSAETSNIVSRQMKHSYLPSWLGKNQLANANTLLQDNASFFTRNPWEITNYNRSWRTQFSVLNNNYNAISTVANDLNIVSQRLGYVTKGAFIVSWGITGHEMVTAYNDNRPEDARGAFFSAVGAAFVGTRAFSVCFNISPLAGLGCGVIGGISGGFGGNIVNNNLISPIIDILPKTEGSPTVSEVLNMHYMRSGLKF